VRMIQLWYTARPSKAPQHTIGIRSGKKDSQTRMGPSVATLDGDDSGFMGDTTVFNRYFSRPAARSLGLHGACDLEIDLTISAVGSREIRQVAIEAPSAPKGTILELFSETFVSSLPRVEFPDGLSL